MIGIIGPADSVALAAQTAAAAGFEEELISRTYRHADEAAGLAQELEESCAVILFTGQVPYMLGGFELAQAEPHFISHSGADLYRCIARVLLERAGVMPVVSIDSIDEHTVLGAFDDLGLPVPSVHHLGPPDPDNEPAGITELLAFHRTAIADGTVEAVFTCLAEVHEALRQEGVPVWRIEHTSATVEEALQKSRLSAQLIRSRSEQLAVALFEIDREELAALDIYEREEVRLRVHRELLDLARRNGGRLTALAGGAFSVAMSRLTLDGENDGEPDGAALFSSLQVGVRLAVGVGVGNTFERAESKAREALDLAHRTGRAHMLFPDGRIHAADAAGVSRTKA